MRIGGGATWGQVAAALAPHGLAISSGDTKSVGVGGLTLDRRHRLEGQEVRPGPGQRGRRGGGHRRRRRRAGERGGEPGAVLGDPRWRRQLRDRDRLRVRGTPDDRRLLRQDRLPGGGGGRPCSRAGRTTCAPPPTSSPPSSSFANPFAGGPEAPVEIHVAFDGDDPELAAEAIDPIRRLGTVIDDDVALKPYADTLVDGVTPPPGIQFVTRSAFVDKESVPEVLRILAEVGGVASGRRSSPSAASAVRCPGSPTTPPPTRTARRS